MKHDKNIDEVLKRGLQTASRDPKDHLEATRTRVLQRLWSTPPGNAADRSGEATVRQTQWHSAFSWWRLSLVAAAAALLVTIGLIAVRQTAPVTNVSKNETVSPQPLRIGETVRTDDKLRTVSLADGSRIEMKSNSELSLQPADDGVQIQLTRGVIIVSAAKQPQGHLYVRTKDMSVAVVGTVFVVGVEKQGSRVAVIEGEVHVKQHETETKLLPGQQMTSSPAMPSSPVSEEVLWSQHAAELVTLLQQTSQQLVAPKTSKWEVTSIRQCTGDTPGNARGGGNGTAPSPGAMGTSPGLLRVTCMPLKWLIERAYVKYYEADMKPTWFFPISGGPAWIESDLFTIMAKTEGLPSEQEMRGPMLQALLEERFNLQMKREIRVEPVYELRIADSGLKIKQLKDGECDAREVKRKGGETDIDYINRLMSDAASRHIFPCGFQSFSPQDGTKTPPGTKTVTVLGGGIDLLTRNLKLDRIIIDKTGLEGRFFDMQLTYSPYKSPMRDPQPVPADPPGGESIFDAFEKQLGLKLVPLNGPRTYYTIEHVERPTPN